MAFEGKEVKERWNELEAPLRHDPNDLWNNQTFLEQIDALITFAKDTYPDGKLDSASGLKAGKKLVLDILGTTDRDTIINLFMNKLTKQKRGALCNAITDDFSNEQLDALIAVLEAKKA